MLEKDTPPSVWEPSPPLKPSRPFTGRARTLILSSSLAGGAASGVERHQGADEALKGRKEEIENTIKLDLKEAERGACKGYGITWRPQTRRTFQTAAFEKAHPNIDLSPFYKTSESRVLRITVNKEWLFDHGS